MPFDASGNFSRVMNWQEDRDNGIRILAERHDEEDNNLAGGLNLTFLRTGTVPMGGDLVMGGNDIRTIAAGGEANPSVSWELNPSTGLYQPSPNQIGVTLNGVKTVIFRDGVTDFFGDFHATGDATFDGEATFSDKIISDQYVFKTDPTLGLFWNAGNVYLGADVNTHIVYDKANTTFRTAIGGVSRLDVHNNGATVHGYLAVNMATYIPGASSTAQVQGDVSILGAFPVVHFNGYYTDGFKAHAAGYTAAIQLDTGSGYLNFYGTNAAAEAGASAPIEVRMQLSKDYIHCHKYVVAPRYDIIGIPDFWFGSPLGSPGINFDANDYLLYDRGDNIYKFRIGGGDKLMIWPSGVVESGVMFKAQAAGCGGSFIERSYNGSNSGYVAFTRVDGGRTGYIGNMGLGWGGDIEYINENGGGHWMRGSNVKVDVGTFQQNAGGATAFLNQYGEGALCQYQMGNWGPQTWISGERNFSLNINGSDRWRIYSDGQVYHRHDIGPMNHHGSICGRPGAAYWVVYTGNLTYTSDARQKEWIGELTDVELAAARDIIAEIGSFYWLKEIAEQGKDAPIHIGVKAQAVWAVMAKHRLINTIVGDRPNGPSRYGFLQYDEWDDTELAEEVPGNEEQGTPTIPAHVREAGSTFGINIHELALFLIAAQEQRLNTIEERLAYLEGYGKRSA